MAEVVIKPLKDNFEKKKTQGNIDKTLVFWYNNFSVFPCGKMGKIIISNGKNIFPNKQWNSKSEQFFGVEKR